MYSLMDTFQSFRSTEGKRSLLSSDFLVGQKQAQAFGCQGCRHDMPRRDPKLS